MCVCVWRVCVWECVCGGVGHKTTKIIIYKAVHHRDNISKHGIAGDVSTLVGGGG